MTRPCRRPCHDEATTLNPGDSLTVTAAAPTPVPVPVVTPLAVKQLGWWHSDQDISMAALEPGEGRPWNGGRTFYAWQRETAVLAQDQWLAANARGRCASYKLTMYDQVMALLAPNVPSPLKTWSQWQLVLPGKVFLAIDHEADAQASQLHAVGQKAKWLDVHKAWVDWLHEQPNFDPARHFPVLITTNWQFAQRIDALWPGKDYSAWLGLDTYGPPGVGDADPAVLVKDALAFCRSEGVRMVWPEWGCVDTGNGFDRPGWIAKYTKFAQQTDIIDWICWWSGTPEYRYDTTPASAAAYKAAGMSLL